jgi:hypothetical protein
MAVDTEADVDPCAVVFPGNDGGHFDDLGRLEMSRQPIHQFTLDRWRGGGHPLGIFQCQPLRRGEGVEIPPRSLRNRVDNVVIYPVCAAPGSVQVTSERAADDRANPQVEQVRQPRRHLL